MRARVGRKYDKLVRYLRGVLDDPKASERMKMLAADKLCNIFLAHDAAEERKAIARERQAARAEAAQIAETQPEAPAEESQPVSREEALRQAEAFLTRIREREKTNAAAV
jgi:hypothetical protein